MLKLLASAAVLAVTGVVATASGPAYSASCTSANPLSLNNCGGSRPEPVNPIRIDPAPSPPRSVSPSIVTPHDSKGKTAPGLGVIIRR
jgi:hypothetical protein